MKNDDKEVFKVAKSKVQKKWKLQKVCSEIIDENVIETAKLDPKESLKAAVFCKEDERQLYDSWRSKNTRYLSLKTASKEGIKSGPFEAFCEKKAWRNEKEKWQVEIEN